MTDLVPDCARCAALCCRLTSFERSDDFALTRRAGESCPYLDGNRCGIHSTRVERGFTGCTLYGCFGAGQALTPRLRDVPPRVAIRAFAALTELHEALFVLRRLPADSRVQTELERIGRLAVLDPHALAELALDGHRALRALVRELAVAVAAPRAASH